MKTKFCLVCTLVAVMSVTTGCKSLFPRESAKPKSPWTTFEEVQAAFDKIEPNRTTVAELKEIGFDPFTTANIKILTYLDIIERFLPNASVKKEDLHEAVRHCLDTKDGCIAYELVLDNTRSKRYGNLCLDVFGFKKKTKISGWNFKALILLHNDQVIYKLRSGQPDIEKYEEKIKPLGPLQELDDVLGHAMKSF